MRVLATGAAVLTLCTAASAQTRIVSEMKTSSRQECVLEFKPAGVQQATGFCSCDHGTECKRTTAYLTDLMLGGSSAALEHVAWSIVEALAEAKDDDGRPIGGALGDLRENYYRLIWKGSDVDGKPAVYQLVLHDGRGQEPDNLLPGIEGKTGPQLYDILATDVTVVQEAGSAGTTERESPLSTLSSVYVSTRVSNPLLSQIPDFVAKTNVLQFWAKATGRGGVRALEPGEQPRAGVRHATRFTIYRAELPHGRATLQVTDLIVTRVPDVDGVVASAEALAARLARPEAGTPGCILRLARAYVENFRRAGPACRVADPVTLGETHEAARDCRDTLDRVLRETTAEARKSKDCTTSDGWNEEITAAQARFKSLVDAVGENSVTATSKLVNEPNTWMSFGVMVAVTVGQPTIADGFVRAKLDGGSFVADPMSRLVTAAVVNLHPLPYQASSASQSWRERLRAFAGVTITPDFGFAAGLGCSLVRGLTANVGGALMWTNAVPADAIGHPIPDGADKNRPFALKTAAVWLFGLSYSFK